MNTRLALIAALTLAAAVPSSVFANGCESSSPCCTNFGTFYTSFGINFVGSNEKTSTARNSFDPSSPIFPAAVTTRVQKFKARGYWKPFGSFSLGYQTPSWCKFYLGLEATITAAPKSQNNEATHVNNDPTRGRNSKEWVLNDLYLTPTYSFTLKPGYEIYQDVSVFGMVGYGTTRAQLRLFGRGIGTPIASGLLAFLNIFDASRHKYLHAFQAGLGFKIRTSTHTSLSMSFLRSNYNSISLSVTSRDPDTGEFAIRPEKTKPDIEAFTTSISYAFNPSDSYCPGDQACRGHEVYSGIVADRDNSFSEQLEYTALARPSLDGNFNTVFIPQKMSSRSWGFEAFAEYGYTFCSGAYLGLEGFYNISPSTYRDSEVITLPANVFASSAGSTAIATTLLKLKESWGISFMPGYKLNDHLLLYVKLGVAKRRLQFKKTFDSVPPPQPRDAAVDNRNETKDIYGYL